MVICPRCKNEIEYEHYECSYRCGSDDLWWCDKCGAIAIAWNGEPPEETDWKFPKIKIDI